VRHRLDGPVRCHEQLREVEPQGGVLGCCLDGALQARDQVCVGHWSPWKVSLVDCDSPAQPRE